MAKVELVYSPTCPGPGWVQCTPELAQQWEDIMNEMEKQTEEINQFLKEYDENRRLENQE